MKVKGEKKSRFCLHRPVMGLELEHINTLLSYQDIVYQVLIEADFSLHIKKYNHINILIGCPSAALQSSVHCPLYLIKVYPYFSISIFGARPQ